MASISDNSSYLGNGYWRGIDYSSNSKLQSVNAFQVGKGDNAIKMDQDGLFFGANKISQAKIRITTEGNFVFNDGTNDRILIGESN
jgi:hypothetical protein